MFKRIYIIGNIGSGKTFLAKLLSKITDYSVVNIDNYRGTVNHSVTFQGENEAYDLFIRKVISSENIIVESTGTSKKYEILTARCPEAIVIKIEIPEEILMSRLRDRKKKKLLPWDFDITDSIRRNDIILSDKPSHIVYNGDMYKLLKELSVLLPEVKDLVS